MTDTKTYCETQLADPYATSDYNRVLADKEVFEKGLPEKYHDRARGDVVNWPLVLEDLRRPSCLDREQANNLALHAKRLAKSWVTCACGNQCASIPRDSEGFPRDPVLSANGTEFYIRINAIHALLDDDRLSARSVKDRINEYVEAAMEDLKVIERRSSELLLILKAQSS